MKPEELFEQLGITKDSYEDLHVVRVLSAFVAVSNGQIIATTEPMLEHCPLVSLLYPQTRRASGSQAVIKEIVAEKISRFRQFTDKRTLQTKDIAVPYGASEMLMYALRKKIIDAAVVVCDGAGTVITASPELVQGIGARMNGLFHTSPIRPTMDRLIQLGCHIPFAETASIDQVGGLKKAAQLGYKKIGVTINACMDNLAEVDQVVGDYGVEIISLVVCTTGINTNELALVRKHADLVWGCASAGVRKLGKRAVLQLSIAIPVFVFTKKGIKLASAYSDDNLIEELDTKKQYLVSSTYKGQGIKMGDFGAYLSEHKLPVRSLKEPRPLR
jgi:putative methanogenesis marker protein 8